MYKKDEGTTQKTTEQMKVQVKKLQKHIKREITQNKKLYKLDKVQSVQQGHGPYQPP